MSKTPRLMTVLLAVGGCLALGTPSAQAAVPVRPISQGTAEAVLHATITGGLTIRFHASVQANDVGAPAQRSTVNISFFQDRQHYCVEDWHTMQASELSVAGVENDGTNQAMFRELASIFISFIVDNEVRVGATKLPIQQVHSFADVRTFGQTTGTVVPPNMFAVGTHSLLVSVVDPVFGDIDVHSTFVMDAPGAGVCLAAR